MSLTSRLHTSFPKPAQSELPPAPQRGSVWSEAALIIGILAVVALAVYLSIDTTRKQADMAQAIDDVTAIQTAFREWAARSDYTPQTLPTWKHLADSLPEVLQEAARGTDDAHLRGSTPWISDYILALSSIDGGTPGLAISGVPEDMREAVSSQMQKIGVTSNSPCALPEVGDICVQLLP